MKLATYLKQHDISASDFAARMKVGDPPRPLSRSAVSRLLSGQRKPSLDLALRIQALTHGDVAVEDWRRKGPFVKDLRG